MQRFLVGGAVRDDLLGLPVKDRDWVVIGATPESMRAAGYKAKDEHFQVYLDPELSEEHSLARTERASGPGHRDFTIDFAPTITLPEDLQRRDLTINAIAVAEDGTFIDPFGGLNDLNAGVLRHVSDAFPEDPLRLFRALRFSAALAQHNFSFADETFELLKQMAAAKGHQTLSSSRIWQETLRALNTPTPSAFIRPLYQLKLYQYGFNTLTELRCEAPDQFERALLAVDIAVSEPTQRLASIACAHQGLLGSAPKQLRDHYPYSEISRREQEFVQTTFNLASALASHPMTANNILQAMEKADARRHSERFQLSLHLLSDLSKHAAFTHISGEAVEQLRRAQSAITSIDVRPLREIYASEELGNAIRERQLEAITKIL